MVVEWADDHRSVCCAELSRRAWPLRDGGSAIATVARRILPGCGRSAAPAEVAPSTTAPAIYAESLHAEVHQAGVDHRELTSVGHLSGFGFGSTPTAPSWVRITTLVETDS